jgi:hypothetical protein
LTAWNNVQKQAEVSLEQANFFIPVIQGEISKLEKDKMESELNGSTSVHSDTNTI